MPITWETLQNAPRLLLEAELQPVQGKRFQPTGFPDLGAATYDVPNNGTVKRMLLVESAQSMANRLEAICWNEATDDLVAPLQGMPYVRVNLWNSGQSTNSILEAHRLNSYYIMNDPDFKEQLRKRAGVPERARGSRRSGEAEEAEDLGGAGLLSRRDLARAAFYYDPATVLHGVFLEKLDGRTRLQRLLSAFIEAENVEDAHSGGVKNDRVAPRPSSLQAVGLSVGAAEGVGNVPYHRTEFVAQSINAYFNLDLAQLRAYGLGDPAERFLTTLALWKVRRFLHSGLRLRTACDLELTEDIKFKKPAGFAIPDLVELEQALPGLIQECTTAGLFANPPITELTFGRR
jgi:CRISPR-associated protein Csb1